MAGAAAFGGAFGGTTTVRLIWFEYVNVVLTTIIMLTV